MSLCYTTCFSLYTTTASAACPNMLDMGCVCKNMDIFDKFSCCIQQNCGTGSMAQTAWSWVEDMCGSYGGAPSSQLTCNSGGSPANTPIPAMTQAAKTTAKVYNTAAPGVVISGGGGAAWGLGGYASPAHATASATSHAYGSAKLASGASSERGVKAFGVAGLLSLGLGALLITAI